MNSVSFIYNAVHVENEIVEREPDRGTAAVAIGVQLLQKPHHAGLDGGKFGFVKMIIAPAGGGGPLHQEDIIGRVRKKTCGVFLTDP